MKKTEDILELHRPAGATTHRMASSGPVGDLSNASSGPLSGPMYNKRNTTKKSARFNVPDSLSSGSRGRDDYVEIEIDVRNDSLAVHSVKPASSDREDPEMALLASKIEKRSAIGPVSSMSRQLSEGLRRLTSSTRRQHIGPLDRNKSAAAHALKGLEFISKADRSTGWSTVEKRFNGLAVDGLLPKALFGQCVGMKEKEFAGELFDALARRRGITSDSITKEQLNEFWEQISDQSFDMRLQTFFDMVDKNADGRVTEEEVKEIITLSASANSLSKLKEQAEEYAALIMEELDPDALGYIELDNLQTLLLIGMTHTERSVRTGKSKELSQMLSQYLKPTREPNPIKRWYGKCCYFLDDNWQRVWLVALWLAACVGLFTWKFMQYRDRAVYHVMGYCVCVAKGGAETLKFNMALILLPVCRNTITWLRNKTKLGVVVPFDDNLNFHKLIAVGVVVGVGLHGIAHLTCDFPRLLHATDAEYEPMKQFFGDERPNNYWWFVKGTEGWTGVVMVVLMAVAFTLATPWFRRGRLNLRGPLRHLTGFNAFWYSHHLLVIVYALLLVHGWYLYLTKDWYKKSTWMYIAIPVVLYACERLTRYLRSRVRPVQILKVAVYPGNVLALHFTKPQGFNYKSGQYMFVNCAAVSPFEWHPFSITSAPEENSLSLHIRTLGDWTRQLRTVFSEVCREPIVGQSGLLRADFQGEERVSQPNFPKVLIDGPYGAPAQDYTEYDVVLLIGLGIGATPFVSIVKDILHNKRKLEASGDDLENNTSPAARRTFKTKKAYFYWITREQGSFEWFRGVMNEVAESDRWGAVELHNYCTSVYEEGDARSALIAMLQSLNHAKTGVDVVSGTKVKSHFAKPNWRNVYKRIAMNHLNDRIGVFYCGAPAPVGELKKLANDFSRNTPAKFDFHKENF